MRSTQNKLVFQKKKKKKEKDRWVRERGRGGTEGVRGLCEKEKRIGGGAVGGLEGEEVNLHILKGAGFFIKKRLKLIYAGALLTHCTL